MHSAGAKHLPRVVGQPCLEHHAACEARQDGTRAHGRGIQSLRQLSGCRDIEEGRTKSDYGAEEMVAEGVTWI